MNWHPLLSLVVLLIPALPAETDSQETACPKEFLEHWAESLLDGKLDRTVAFYEDSKEVVAIQSSGKVRKGIAEIRKEYQAAFDEVEFEKVSLKSLSVRQNGGVAWATCEFKADTRVKADQRAWLLHVRSSFVLERSGKSWKIVLEHFSPIAGIPRVQRK
jgi:ketosteroid isomerase-like protein